MVALSSAIKYCECHPNPITRPRFGAIPSFFTASGQLSELAKTRVRGSSSFVAHYSWQDFRGPIMSLQTHLFDLAHRIFNIEMLVNTASRIVAHPASFLWMSQKISSASCSGDPDGTNNSVSPCETISLLLPTFVAIQGMRPPT